MKYKALFFDRDGTLTYPNPEKMTWRDETIRSWSGKPFELSYDKMTALFDLVAAEGIRWDRTLGEEITFFKRYYRHLLLGEGVQEKLDERAKLLFDELWCNDERAVYPEVVRVLRYFHLRDYKMGVISDTSPSLELTLRQVGLAPYFSSFTSSAQVGVSKPDPLIFSTALNALHVTAMESLYVDDDESEADGARALGFTSFLIDRSGKNTGRWTITSLWQIVDYVNSL